MHFTYQESIRNKIKFILEIGGSNRVHWLSRFSIDEQVLRFSSCYLLRKFENVAWCGNIGYCSQ